MARTRTIIASLAGVLILGACIGLLGKTRSEAHRLITNPMYSRVKSDKTPWDEPWRMPFVGVTVKSADGTTLRGWFIPAESRKLILLQHGYKDRLQSDRKSTRLNSSH